MKKDTVFFGLVDFRSKERITTYARVDKMDSTNVKILSVVTNGLQKPKGVSKDYSDPQRERNEVGCLRSWWALEDLNP